MINEEAEYSDKITRADEISSRLTRQKAHQIATGTHLFKLGMDNSFKSYVNQYVTNAVALTKSQKNEERDKKRYLCHKFSLSSTPEFKWIGNFVGSRPIIIQTLKQTLLHLESNIPSYFFHPNWTSLKKTFISRVGSCLIAEEFSRLLIMLQSCVKSVVFVSAWHEQLGHVRLERISAVEREEKKRLDKKEKKEKDDEEEKNRLNYNFVKYTLGLKHQVWKQKGEEYRVHGQKGWLWISKNRKCSLVNSQNLGLKNGPQKIMVQVKDKFSIKILAVDQATYNSLTNEYHSSKYEEEESSKKDELNERDYADNPDVLETSVNKGKYC